MPGRTEVNSTGRSVGRDGRTARLVADHAAALLTFVSHVISSDLVSAREPIRL